MEWNEKLQIIIDYVENHLQKHFTFFMEYRQEKHGIGMLF